VKNCLCREAGKRHHHRQLDKGARRKWNSGADMGATLVSQAIWQGAPGTIARRVLLADGPKQRLSSEKIGHAMVVEVADERAQSSHRSRWH